MKYLTNIEYKSIKNSVHCIYRRNIIMVFFPQTDCFLNFLGIYGVQRVHGISKLFCIQHLTHNIHLLHPIYSNTFHK